MSVSDELDFPISDGENEGSCFAVAILWILLMKRLNSSFLRESNAER
jgi:hypothetical protein